jgi:hypothetical protein
MLVRRRHHIECHSEWLMQSYNGYSPQERARKVRAVFNAMLDDQIGEPWPPCALCGDPWVTCDFHSEDYSQPYRFRPPAMYSVFTSCHSRLHSRFSRPDRWEAFKAHIRRGGYASDLHDPKIAREWNSYVRERSRGRKVKLSNLRRYRSRAGSEWWARLSVDPRTLRARSARRRP